MKKPIEKSNEADKMINDFCSKFHHEFGFWPTVSLNSKSFFVPQLTLEQLKSLINSVFKKTFPDIYTEEGMFYKTRKQLPILYRHLFYKIAREIGYTLTDIGRYSSFNHATILYAERRVCELLEIRDPEITKNYNLIKNEINNRYGNDGDVQHDSQRESNAEPVLFFVLPKRKSKPNIH